MTANDKIAVPRKDNEFQLFYETIYKTSYLSTHEQESRSPGMVIERFFCNLDVAGVAMY